MMPRVFWVFWKYLRLAVAAAVGETHVNAEHTIGTCGIDAGLLDGVTHNHARRASHHAQRLLQRRAVAPPLVLCNITALE